MSIIDIECVSKQYHTKKHNQIKALDNVNLEIKSGEIFGLLGPNGAGKTTLIKILLGITRPNSGSVKIFEHDISDWSSKKRIGYLPENLKYPNYLTGKQILNFFGSLSGIEDKKILSENINKYMVLLDIEKWRDIKVGKYSKGMLQRLGLAQALLNDPEILFLDEPTDGVDPLGRKDIRDILLKLKNLGKTIFLNSHLLLEVEQISDRVAILNKGQLIKTGVLEEMRKSTKTYEITLSDIPEKAIPERLKFVFDRIESNNRILISVQNITELNEIIDKLRSEDFLIESVSPVKKSLEEIFINLINESNQKEKI